MNYSNKLLQANFQKYESVLGLTFRDFLNLLMMSNANFVAKIEELIMEHKKPNVILQIVTSKKGLLDSLAEGNYSFGITYEKAMIQKKYYVFNFKMNEKIYNFFNQYFPSYCKIKNMSTDLDFLLLFKYKQ